MADFNDWARARWQRRRALAAAARAERHSTPRAEWEVRMTRAEWMFAGGVVVGLAGGWVNAPALVLLGVLVGGTAVVLWVVTVVRR